MAGHQPRHSVTRRHVGVGIVGAVVVGAGTAVASRACAETTTVRPSVSASATGAPSPSLSLRPTISARIPGSDITSRLQKAFDAIPEGTTGRVVIPAGVHSLSRSVTATGKTIVLVLHGTLKDAFKGWAAGMTSDRLDDKGVLSFRRCDVTLIGKGSVYHLDGSNGTPGLAAEGRNMLFFDRCKVQLTGLRTKDSTATTIVGFGCSGVTYRHCTHVRAGQYGVFFLGGRDYTIDRIKMRGSVLGALSVNRTGFGLALGRPQHVTITNCDIRGYTASNNYAGGIVVNDGDYVRAVGNVSDGEGKASFAYSFAGSSHVYSRNTALNMSNNRVGTYGYAGVAFELDGTTYGDFDDTMVDCLGGYLLANTRHMKLKGNYTCDAGRHRRLDSAAGKTGMFMIANTQARSASIVVDGASCSGGNSFMTGAMLVDGLTIRNATISDTFYSVFNFDGGSVTGLAIDNLRYSEPGAVPTHVIQAADGVLKGVTVDGAVAKAGRRSGRDLAFFDADVPGGALRFDGVHLTNFDIGIEDPFGRARSLTLIDCTFAGVRDPVPTVGAGTVTALHSTISNGRPLVLPTRRP